MSIRNAFALPLALLFSLTGPVAAQGPPLCLGAALYSQADVDDYWETFGCTELSGDLILNGLTIEDLSPLSLLTSVGGLEVVDTDLTSLEGLGLTSVSGSITIRDNDLLEYLTGLEGLTAVGGDIEIEDNPALLSLSGLDFISDVGAGVRVASNESLLSVSLPELTTVGSSGSGSLDIKNHTDLGSLVVPVLMTVGSSVEIVENEVLTALSFPMLSSVGGDIEIIENDDLLSLEVPLLSLVPETLEIDDNCSLEMLSMPQLTEVLDELVLRCTDLTTLSGLSALEAVGATSGDDFEISDHNITSLAGLSSLLHVHGDLRVSENDDLESLAGLTVLTEIGGALDIRYNDHPLFTSLAGLGGIESLGGLKISGNVNLTALTGLTSLASVGDITVDGTSLTGLTELAGLAPDGEIQIQSNQELLSLEGLGGATSIHELSIRNNDQLVSLAGLENVTGTTLNVVIRGNAVLASLDALERLDTIGNQLDIQDNPALAACFAGLAGLMGYTGSPSVPAFTNVAGTIRIRSSNAVGCQSEAEVLAGAFSLSTTPLDGRRGDPVPPPVEIYTGPTGTKVFFRSTTTDHMGAPFTMDAWTSVTLPSGTVLTRRRAKSVGVDANGSRWFNGVVNFTDGLDFGTYLITVYQGTFPDGVLKTESFEVELLVPPGFARSRPSQEVDVYALLFGDDDLEVEGEAADTASRPGASAEATLDALPIQTALGSAYPNPFNPTATVPFTLAQDGDVRLAVYDLLGREVAVLAQGAMSAGSHTAVFDAGQLASGTYLVRLSAAGAPAQTQRLTLVK